MATDCKPGLVCITQADQKRRCTNDLSAIASTEQDAAAAPSSPSPPEYASGDAAGPAPAFDATSGFVDSAGPEGDASAGDSASEPEASFGDSGSGDDGGLADGSDEGPEP